MGERVKNNVEATDVAEKDARGGEGGMLSLVGTPIGNLSDASPRVLETLRGADVLLCEDTRVTSKLLARFGIRVALERCDENVIASRVEGVLARVAGGARVAFVSDAGMPGVSDPGQRLVDAALDEGLPVEVIPSNKPVQRVDHEDLVYRTIQAKYNAVADDVERRHAKGQPVLVGTVSIESSEKLSAALTKRGIAHEVLNAKFHEREAQIVAQAGREGAVTIATNMAGRGTDILLGGNPDELADEMLAEAGTPADIATPEQLAEARKKAREICSAERERVLREREAELRFTAQDVQSAQRGNGLTVFQTQGTALAVHDGELASHPRFAAFLKDAPIVVLDEATAFADPENEALIQRAFTRLAKGRTVVMIAHRLSTVVGADKIVVLDRGRVAESGTHEALLAKGGLYAKMWADYERAANWKISATVADAAADAVAAKGGEA